MGKEVVIDLNDRESKVNFNVLSYSVSQESVSSEDGSSVIITYLDSHIEMVVDGFEKTAVVRLQKIFETSLDSEGCKISYKEIPLKFSSVDEVIAAVTDKIKEELLSDSIDKIERSVIKNVIGKMSQLVVH